MLMPILRLVLIYVVLAGAVVAVFNRDRVLPLFFGSGDDPAPVAAPAQPAPAAQDHAAQAAPAPAAPAPAPAPAAPADTRNGMLQSPTAPGTAAPAAQPATSDADLADALNAARRAWWQGDRAGAEAQMQALAEANPDNPDIFGELGNLELALQQWAKAGDALHKAALLLIDQGRTQEAMTLVPVLNTVAPDKAADLGARLQNR